MSDSASIPSAEHLVELRRAREAELILLFCDGKILGEAEMAEIAHILPPAVLSNPPAPDLIADVDHYAKAIGTSRRTIFRWLDLGRKAKDHCPLDDPAKMLAWWSRNMTHRTPDYLTDWVSRCASTPGRTVPPPPKTISPGAGAAAASGKSTQPPRGAIDMQQLAGHGLEAGVQILRQNVEANAQLLAEAYRDPNDQRLSQYQSRFEDAVEQLRKAEGSLLALQKSRGDLAPRSEFRADLHLLITGLRGMMRRRADNLCSTMSRYLSPEQLGILRAAVVALGDDEEKLLRTSRHWQLTPSGELQLPAA